MYNIALFSPILTDDNSLALKKFLEIYHQNICQNLIIFTDAAYIYINEDIPILSTSYIRQKFKEYYILTDIENIDYLDESLKIIAVYNDVCQNIPKNKCIASIPVDSDFLTEIKRITNETI